MKTQKFIQERTEASINSVEGIQRATPSPFFYTRLIAKLSNRELSFWEKFSAIITRPTIAFACMCIIVLMNVVAVYTNSEAASVTDQNEIAATDEFTQVAPGFYDLENIKP